ncbi:uncharacterized protein LOC108713859 isoform X2 [Xenopus laevis]|uniref:Uncharacterized protein LOC108713859 isoform X2 n=2 Tax=Xenopus laevis TaxID=8355 RepID=A0A1L8GJD6_XENLA|nr:uncharacterized protein LOC108713859 isoform X2 [Xenopus laevis]OCT83954.1 hypothetical protein XELAEV_18022092mg [Xenopus laevis]
MENLTAGYQRETNQLAYISLFISCVTRLLLFITLFSSQAVGILHSMKLYNERYRRIWKASGWVFSGLFIGLCAGQQNVTSVLLSINIFLFFSNWILPVMIPIMQLVLFRFVLGQYRGVRLKFNPKNLFGEFIAFFFFVFYCAFIASLSIIVIFTMNAALIYYSISSYFLGFMPWQWILLYFVYVAIMDTFLFISGKTLISEESKKATVEKSEDCAANMTHAVQAEATNSSLASFQAIATNLSGETLNKEPQECHSSENSTHSHVKTSPANPKSLKLSTPAPNSNNPEHLPPAATQSAQPISDHWLTRIKRGLKMYKTNKNNRHVTKRCRNKIV